MKKSFIWIAILLFFSGCIAQKNNCNSEFTSIDYVAYSRGFYLWIGIDDSQSISLKKNRRDKPVVFAMSDNDWEIISSLITDLNLDSISTSKAPTEKRFYDGAAIANLKILKRGKTYQSQSFDHGFPPKEIEKIVNKIITFANNYDDNTRNTRRNR